MVALHVPASLVFPFIQVLLFLISLLHSPPFLGCYILQRHQILTQNLMNKFSFQKNNCVFKTVWLWGRDVTPCYLRNRSLNPPQRGKLNNLKLQMSFHNIELDSINQVLYSVHYLTLEHLQPNCPRGECHFRSE